MDQGLHQRNVYSPLSQLISCIACFPVVTLLTLSSAKNISHLHPPGSSQVKAVYCKFSLAQGQKFRAYSVLANLFFYNSTRAIHKKSSSPSKCTDSTNSLETLNICPYQSLLSEWPLDSSHCLKRADECKFWSDNPGVSLSWNP